MTKLPEGLRVCVICREIVPIEDLKDFVSYVSWGSFSGTPHYAKCCSLCHKTKFDKDGYVIEQAYV